MKSCALYPSIKTSDNEIKDSKLFKDLLSYTSNNRSQAKKLYLITKNEDFQSDWYDKLTLDELGEPTLTSLINTLDLESYMKDSDSIDYINRITGNLNTLVEDNTENYNNIVNKAIEFNDNSEFNKKFTAILRRKDNSIYLSIERKTDSNDLEARKMKSNTLINRRISDILLSNGFTIGSLTQLEEELGISGVTEFEVAKTAANGISDIIRLAKGSKGQAALGEEFAHFVLETMQDDSLVQRLMTLIRTKELAKTILGDQYEHYSSIYNEDQLIREAAGKIVTKHFFNNEEVTENKSFLQRVFSKIKSKFNSLDELSFEEAIKESEDLAGQISNTILNTSKIESHKIEVSDSLYQLEKKTIRQKEILDKSINTLIKRLNLYTKLNEKKNLTEEEQKSIESWKEKERANISELKTLLAKNSFSKGILSYITNSVNELKLLTSKLNDVKNSNNLQYKAYQLRNIKNYLDGYNSITNLIQECLLDEDNWTDKTSMESIKVLLNNFNTEVSNIKIEFNRQTLNTFSNWLAVYMPSEGITIKNKTITSEDLVDLLQSSNEDMGLLSVWLDSAAQSRDIIIKLADRAMKTAKENKRNRVLDIQKRLLAISKNLKDSGISNNDWMFERKSDGSLSNIYISELNWTKYKEDEAKMLRELNSKYGELATGESGKAKLKEKADWYKTHSELGKPKSSIYKVKLNLTKAQKDYYDGFMSIREELISLLPKDIYEKNPNLAVQIRKDLMERLGSTNILNWGSEIKNSISDQLISRIDDADRGFTLAMRDFNNREVMSVPVYFTRELENSEFLSRDTTSTLLAFADMAINYDEMYNVADLFEIGKGVLEQREVQETKGGKPAVEVIKDEGRKISQAINKTDKNFVKAYNELLESQLYGRFLKPGEDIVITDKTAINTNKAARFFNKITSLNQLALNALSAIASVGNDIIQVNSEVLAGEHFSAKQLWDADKIYRKELVGVLGEVGNPIKINKLNLFLEKFDILHDYENEIRDIQWDKSRMKKLLSTNSLYFMMHMGSHWGESRTALAQALNTELIKEDGTKINLWDALEVKYINPSKPELGATLQPVKGVKFSAEESLAFSRKAQGLNQSLYGIYNNADKNALSRTALGSMVMLYRNYLVPALNRRFSKADYNLDTQSNTEGYYRTLGRFLKQLYNDREGFYLDITTHWDDLSDAEKANLKRCANELTTFVILVGVAALTSKLDWDNKDNPWLKRFTALMSRRLKTEIGGLTPIGLGGETFTLLKSPMAGIKTMESAFDTFGILNPWHYQIVTDEALITTGRYKGHSKAYRDFMNSPFVPMNKTVYKILHPETVMAAYN